jgi:hypothetical protein
MERAPLAATGDVSPSSGSLASPGERAAGRTSTPRRSREGSVVALVFTLVVAAVGAAHAGRWTPASDLGYSLGLAGGVAMLLLFLYPLRKRVRFLQRFGATRRWFALHMLLGVAGPLLIILHSRLLFGSLNALVAFASMALVASSGLVGRFLYARIHRGLYGEKATLAELGAQARAGEEAMHALAAIAPEVVERLDRYAAHSEAVGRSGLARPIAFFALGFRGMRERHYGVRVVRQALRRVAEQEAWDAARLARRIERRRSLVASYVATVQRLAQFAVFERLFSWWHVLHVPLVWLMVASAIAHVVAVHMY